MSLSKFSPKQREYYFRSRRSWLNVAEGGVRGGKNVLNVLAFCHAVERNPAKFHLIMGVTVAAAQMYIVECDGFGVMYHFAGRAREGKYKDWPCVYVTTAYGDEKIILVHGANDGGSERKLKGATLGCVYVTEANECDKGSVLQSFKRTMSAKEPRHFHDLNPKPGGHWYYKDLINFHEAKQAADADYGYNYGHFTIWDNLSVTDAQLRRELAKHDPDSVGYKRDILGKRVALEGLIYPMFNYEFHTEDEKPRPYSEYYVGVDYGHSNATAMGLFGLSDGVYFQISEYYHSERETGRAKTPREYYEALCELCGDLDVRYVVVDPSAKGFINEIKHHKRFRVRRGANDVLPGIYAVKNALDKGVLKFNRGCVYSIRDFSLYSWDQGAFEDVPMKSNEHGHCADFIRYLVYTLGWGSVRKGFVTV